jgi:hypothetical protein
MSRRFDALHLIAVPVTVYLFWYYAAVWLTISGDYLLSRPYIYRALVPLLTWPLRWMGISYGAANIIIMFAALVGFWFAIRVLYLEFWTDRADLAAYAAAWILLSLSFYQRKPYDIPAAFLFTLAFLLMARGQLARLVVLFPVLCLTKETAIFIPLLFAVWFWRRIRLTRWLLLLGYQAAVFIMVQSVIRSYYASAPGYNNPLRLMDNLIMYWQRPAMTALFLLFAAWVLWRVFRGWNDKPPFLRTALTVLAPLVLILHLVTGYPFEIRVFAEVFPILYLMAIQ